MHFDTLMIEKQEHIAILALNQPRTINAMTPQMAVEFKDAIHLIQEDKNIRVLIITGEGHSFCSGGDLKSAFEMFESSPAKAEPTVVNFYKCFLNLTKLEIPTIAVIKGHTIGAGLCLAMACDMRIASSNTKMSMSFIKVGIHPGMAGTYHLPRLVGTAKALELCLLGEVIGADEAMRIGLVNHVIAPDQLEDFSLDFARRIANNPAVTARLIKRSIYRNLNVNLDDALLHESLSQILSASTEDMKEGLSATREKRSPVFKGC
ncbi:MAG: enoyl-CoA hydratase/isomerase family protein [Syntrophomonadaceae bacterium]|jgi:enoyl-CoA hydratase/carnithine racemase